MSLSLPNTRYRMSLYNSLYHVSKPYDTIDVNQLIEIVKYGYLKEQISRIRKETNHDEYSALKNSTLPCVTTSGIFGYRNKEGLQSHNGLIQIDLDKVPNYDRLFKALCDDEFTYLCFRSPGGNGIKVVIKILPSKETHAAQFKAICDRFEKLYQAEVDRACCDLSRAMLLSYDPDLFCNPGSKEFVEKADLSKPEAVNKRKFPARPRAMADSYHQVEELVVAIETVKTDITAGYDRWYKIGFALISEFGEEGREFFHRISQFHETYSPPECDKKYDSLLKSSKQGRQGGVTLGTLFHFARESGVYW